MSTAKSMAAQYLNAKRAGGGGSKTPVPSASRFKSSTSNLATSLATTSRNSNNSRLKSTSMTNLVASGAQDNNDNQTKIHRPASRNALDSIHMGMNAKYAQVQSKVLLQNIRPQQQMSSSDHINGGGTSVYVSNNSKSKIPATRGATARKSMSTLPASSATGRVQQSDRSQLINKIKSLQADLERQEQANADLIQELEREKADKSEQIQQVKLELQEKLAEHERQNEDYHQKLLEAYELADQNRRAADNVLNESRQRDEESRKRIEELEQQLAEMKEFVTMKEEMAGKMSELREQIREERERYEEKTRSLNQMFESEKISMQVDQNSNYFRRIKPSLQSTESVNRLTGNAYDNQCTPTQGSAQLHRSEHDIYGSKLSTRMQDTARSAWKASRKFASSVITGSVGGLSACRQCTRKRSSGASLARPGAATTSGRLEACAGPVQLERPIDDEQHTSVIEVGRTVGDHLVQQQQQQQQQQAAKQESQPVIVQPSPVMSNGDESLPHQQTQSLIRVDENNKLTIVTKFNDSDCNSSASGANLNSTPASSSGCSERSRCESSSSGRGTASDAGSSASQNGDLEGLVELANGNNGGKQQINGTQVMNGTKHHHCVQHQHQEQPNSLVELQVGEQNQRHKRKSSLFKASKVFGGSQASLNKLRSFFAIASAKSNGNKQPSDQVFGELRSQSLALPPFDDVPGQHHQSSKHADEEGQGGTCDNNETTNCNKANSGELQVGQGDVSNCFGGNEAKLTDKQQQQHQDEQQVPIQIQVQSSARIALESS